MPRSANKVIGELASLPQQGHSLQQINVLYLMSALRPVVQIRTPKFQDIADWDVHEVHVRRFEKVEAGTKLLTLENKRTLFLKASPAGSETASVQTYLKNAFKLEAVPLIQGTGPRLKDLSIDYVSSEENG